MCLIAIVPKGVKKITGFFEEALRNGAAIQTDGFGYTFKKAHNQAIYYHKGHMNVDKLLLDIKAHKLKDEDELIVHLRKKSYGKISAENCHPFVLTPDDDQICDVGPSTTIYPVMVHNGHFSDFCADYDYSDTYHFVKEFMRMKDIYTMMKTDKLAFKQVFGDMMGNNRLAMFFPKTTQPLVTYGEFISDHGCLFSNHSYLPSANRSIKIPDRTSNYIEHQFSTKTRWGKLKSDAVTRKGLTLFESESHYNALDSKVTLTEENCNELVFVAKQDCEPAIKKGEKYLINEWSDGKTQFLQQLQDQTIFAWVTLQVLSDNFDMIPKSIYKDKYHDYFRLTKLIEPTKSSIKKIYRTYKRSAEGKKSKASDFKINIKYKNCYIKDLRLDSMKMFINDHAHFVENSMII